MTKPSEKQTVPARAALHEDWQAVLFAFLLILLSAVGLLGPNGIHIRF